MPLQWSRADVTREGGFSVLSADIIVLFRNLLFRFRDLV